MNNLPLLFLSSFILLLDAKIYNRLFEDLLGRYNKLVRPAKDANDTVSIQFKLKLTQLVDVHEKHQVMTTHGWLIHKWYDYRLAWNPVEYGGILSMPVPGEFLWLPDIILYNNAHGTPSVGAITKASIRYDGLVTWDPPVKYNSMCKIDVKWFPYDEQDCEMKFGSWTYSGTQLDMVHLSTDLVESAIEDNEKVWIVERGVDISEYQESVEWDLLSVRSTRHEKWYPCCDYPSIDITFYLNIRRKKLFVTVNLVFPCVSIAALTSWVFYLPCESRNKLQLCINVLVSLTVIFLVLMEIIPPTSVVIPLIGKFLVFTMFMVTLSVISTVVVENVHFRQSDYPMSNWIRVVFIEKLGRKLLISRRTERSSLYRKIQKKKNIDSINAMHILEKQFNKTLFEIEMASQDKEQVKKESQSNIFMQLPMMDRSRSFKPGQTATGARTRTVRRMQSTDRGKKKALLPLSSPERKERNSAGRREILRRAERNVHYIAQHLTDMRKADEAQADWRFVSLVIDRILLIIFGTVITLGVFSLLSAPSFRDQRKPINSNMVDEF